MVHYIAGAMACHVWSVYKFLVFQGLTAVRPCAFAITLEKGGSPPPPLILPWLGSLPFVLFTPGRKVELTQYWPHVRQCKVLWDRAWKFNTVPTGVPKQSRMCAV